MPWSGTAWSDTMLPMLMMVPPRSRSVDRRAAAIHHAPEVHVEEPLLVGQRHLGELAVDRDAGIVHPGVDAAERRGRLRRQQRRPRRRLATSATAKMARPPASLISRSRRAGARLRSCDAQHHAMRRARAAICAVARPMPLDAPVMTMVWSLNFFGRNLRLSISPPEGCTRRGAHGFPVQPICQRKGRYNSPSHG